MNSHAPAVGRDQCLLARVREPDAFVEDASGVSDKHGYDELLPQPPSTRKSRASFSGFGHVVRAFPKRIAFHRKTPKPADHACYDDYTIDFPEIALVDEKSVMNSPAWDPVGPHTHSRTPGWLRRCVSTKLRSRRQTADTPSRPVTAKRVQQDFHSSPIPVVGFAPPTFPDDLSSGTAARAAAAEQNEMFRCLRKLHANERCVRRDSESGIGIEVRPLRRVSTVPRIGKRLSPISLRPRTTLTLCLDPFDALPRELFTHILSYLDAQSLIHSELVSRRWHSVASDDLVWKRVFFKDFSSQSHRVPENLTKFQVCGQGLGSGEAEQDWKRMWRTRKALDQRWFDSHAAAIYLEGHYDSVYCVQFDE